MGLRLAAATSLALSVMACPISAQDQAPEPLQTQVLDRFEPLIGEWFFDFDSIPKEAREAQKSGGLELSWLKMGWGTDRQWMSFEDLRQTKGEVRVVGEGLIAFSPMHQKVVFTEHGARGAMVTGTLSARGEGVFVRDITVARADRTWRQVDEWRLSADGRCMVWNTVYHRRGEQQAAPPFQYCKKPDAAQ